MVELQKIFHVEYPSTLIFSQQSINNSGFPFVSSRGTNNGISGRVNINPKAKMYPKGSITVPLKGTVLQAFLQTEDFYCAHQIAVLIPNPDIKMTEKEKLFYCVCIRQNKYRYNYGRQADRTITKLLVPSIDEIPNWINETKLEMFDNINQINNSSKLSLNASEWKSFIISDLFILKKGKRLTKAAMTAGKTIFIGSIDKNNGVSGYVGQTAIHEGNTITVNYNGSVAEAFYQPKPFWASDDVNVLYPKFNLTPAIAMFLITIIKNEKYRYNYGRKWHLERMKQSQILLPITLNSEPDWDFMEEYINSLPFSSQLCA